MLRLSCVFGFSFRAIRDSFLRRSLTGGSMSRPRDDRQTEFFRPALDQIVDLGHPLGHPLVRLAAEIDWDFLATRFGAVYRPGPGQPPLPTG
jgi:IS5 family transposase